MSKTIKFLVICLFAVSAHAADTLRIIVPFAAGGNTDLAARVYARELTEQNINVVVINRPGAEGIIGTQELMNSKPDGNTLLFTGNSAIVYGAITNPVARDALNKIVPIMQASIYGQMLVARNDSDIKTFEQLRNALKTRTVAIASSGVTSRSSLEELFPNNDNLIIINVPGDSGALLSLANKSVEVATVTAIIEDRIASGEFVGLATISQHSRGNVKSLVEQGYPVYRNGWSGFFAPPGTPLDIRDKLYLMLERVRQSAIVQQQIHNIVRATIAPKRTPEQFVRLINDDFNKASVEESRRLLK